jgi:hypothetical protein
VSYDLSILFSTYICYYYIFLVTAKHYALLTTEQDMGRLSPLPEQQVNEDDSTGTTTILSSSSSSTPASSPTADTMNIVWDDINREEDDKMHLL